jgi:molybdopterin synthase catalytic subunit
VAASYRRVTSPESGGINMFIGSVRSQTDGRAVQYLQFEAYNKMATREMKKIAEVASQKWSVHNILVHHRIGRLEVGEIPVIIAVAATRRQDAIKASHYIIDELKAVVPIWKKEVFEDGEVWVSSHP